MWRFSKSALLNLTTAIFVMRSAMKKIFSILMGSVLSVPAVMAANPVEFYGIAHVSIDSISGAGVIKDTQINSRSSRLGVKGEKNFKGGLQGFYKFEFQYDMADDNNGDDFIKSRNMYVGIKDADLGSLLIGRHDTAMKKAIGIKIFSDTVAEMTSVMGKDVGLYNRTNNTIFYKSKKIGPVQVMASVSTLEGDAANESFDVESIAVTYKTKKLYVGLAHETITDFVAPAIQGQEGSRLTVGYTFDSGNKVGVGYESGKYDTGVDHKAYVINGIMKLSDLYKVKATYGKRTAAKDETAFAIGLVRDLGDKSELYAIYHADKDDNAATDVKTVSLGMTYVF